MGFIGPESWIKKLSRTRETTVKKQGPGTGVRGPQDPNLCDSNLELEAHPPTRKRAIHFVQRVSKQTSGDILKGPPDPGRSAQEEFDAGNQGQSVPAAGDLSELKFFLLNAVWYWMDSV